MTKEAIKATLEEIITRYGFSFEYYSHTWLPVVTQSNDDYAGINFTESWDFDCDAKTCTTTISCQSRVCRMGSTPSVTELLEAAKQIERAAQLMEEVNALGLTHTERFGE